MAIIEPNINLTDFKKDFFNGMSAHNLQAKYILTPRQYRRLRDKVKKGNRNPQRKRTAIRTVRNNDEFNEVYVTKKDGKYLLRKKRVYYGQYNSLEEARYIKQRMTELNWDRNQLDKVRDEINIKPLRSYKYDKQGNQIN
jgi:hypothetical protein